MKAIHYGEKNKEVMLFLHGGGLSWWNYRGAACQLQTDYHVVIPVLDGHGDSDRDFVSIEENARALIAYIEEQFGGSVLLIGGLSLGGQILTEMLSIRKDICKFAVIESALLIPSKFIAGMTAPMLNVSYWMIKETWFAKLQFWSLKMKNELFGDYYRDSCRITKENMVSFLKANSLYRIPEELNRVQAKVYIFVGGREQRRMIRSAEKLHSIIPESELEIWDNMYHGQLSLNNSEQYCEKIYQMIRKEIPI